MGGLLQLLNLLEKIGDTVAAVAAAGIPGVDQKLAAEIKQDVAALKEIATGHINDPNKNAVIDWLTHGGNRHGTPESRAAEEAAASQRDNEDQGTN